MALPENISTCAVTIGSLLDFAGDTYIESVEWQPVLDGKAYAGNVRSITWTATGQALASFAEKVESADGEAVTVDLPHVDQAGFIDGSGDAFTKWTYRVRVRARDASRKTYTKTKFIQPLVGQATADFDPIPDGTIGVAVSTPSPVVISVNGDTGAVVVPSAGDVDAKQDIATLSADAAVLVDDGSALDVAVAAKIAARPLLPVGRLRGWGHSIMYGSSTGGVVIGVDDLATLTADALGLPLSNHAESGASLYTSVSDADWATISDTELRGQTFEAAGGIYALMYGINDAASLGWTADLLKPFKSALRASTALLRSSAVFEHDDDSVTYGGSGSWASNATTSFGGHGFHYNGTAGATITVDPAEIPTFPGGTLNFYFIGWNDGGGATISATVNDIEYSVDTTDSNVAAGSNRTEAVLRIPNVKRTTDPIVLTTSDVSEIGCLFFRWSWEPPEASCPPIALIAMPKPLDYTAQDSAPAGPGTDAGVDVINGIIADVCDEFGDRVPYVDTSAIDKDPDYWEAGNIHPNAAGHAYIAEQTSAALLDIGTPMRLALAEPEATEAPTAWISWTPTLGGSGTSLGNGTTLASYTERNDGVVEFYTRITLGSTSVIGTDVTVSLPETAATAYSLIGLQVLVNETGAGRNFIAGYLSTTSVVRLQVPGTSGRGAAVTSTAPFTWGATDYIEVRGSYIKAAA